jgi:hypothetical protein
MIRFVMLLPLFVLCACQPDKSPVADAASPQPADSSFVLPGTFSQRTTLADFEKLFGKANVRIIEEPGDNNTRMLSLVLFPDDPTRRAFVGFHDSEKLTDLASISVQDAESRWRGKRGVRVGMSFAELRKLNGKPFYFSGFDNQHRGWVRDQWSPALDDKDDRLGTLDVAEDEHMYFGVNLGLRGQAKDIPATAYPVDDSISSDDPRYPRLGELVVVTAINASTSLDDEWE